jgi:hypothetical protein
MIGEWEIFKMRVKDLMKDEILSDHSADGDTIGTWFTEILNLAWHHVNVAVDLLPLKRITESYVTVRPVLQLRWFFRSNTFRKVPGT